MKFMTMKNIIPDEVFRQTMINNNFIALAYWIDHHPECGLTLSDGQQFEIATMPFVDGQATLILTYYVEYAGGPEEQKPCLDVYLDGEDYTGYCYVKRYTDWRRHDWKEQMERYTWEERQRYMREA